MTTNKEFYDMVQTTFDECSKILKAKGADYTKGSQDALANFKEAGAAIDLDPKKVWYIFANKHWQAISNYIKTGGQSESEPIDERIKDEINYLLLLKAIIAEERKGNSELGIVQRIVSEEKATGARKNWDGILKEDR